MTGFFVTDNDSMAPDCTVYEKDRQNRLAMGNYLFLVLPIWSWNNLGPMLFNAQDHPVVWLSKVIKVFAWRPKDKNLFILDPYNVDPT